jgi:CheY-like chemotaxis protein
MMAEGTTPSARCILIVDDEPGMRESLADVFEANGYHVHTAASGEAGVEVIARDACRQVVLMDIRMPPGLNGVEAMRLMRALVPTLPVVLMTAYANEATASAAERDATAVLQKPLDLALTLPLLDSIIEGR